MKPKQKKTKTPPKPELSVPQPSELIETVLLGSLLTLLTLRVTLTEGPPLALSSLTLNLADPLYSVLISVALLFISAVWWIWRLSGGAPRYRSTGLEAGLMILLGIACIGAFFADNKRLAINYILIIFSPGVAALTLVQLLHRQDRIQLVLIVLVALGVLVTAHGVSQIFMDNQDMIDQYQNDPNGMLKPLGIERGTLPQFLFEHRLHSRGMSSYFSTRNSAGCFLLIPLFATLALSSTRYKDNLPKKAFSYLLTGCLVFLFLGLVLSKSKAAGMGLVGALVALAFLIRYLHWLAQHRATAIFLFLILGLLGIVAIGAHGLAHGSLPGGTSMLVRWQYWQATGQLISDHLWTGVGPGNFASHYLQYKPPQALEAISDPHNLLLSITAQLGIPGLLSLLMLILGPWVVSQKQIVPDSIVMQAPPLPHPKNTGFVITVLTVGLLLLRPILTPQSQLQNAVVLTHLLVLTYLFVIPWAITLAVAIPLVRFIPRGTASKPPLSWIIPLGGVFAVLLANTTDFAIFEPPVLTGLWLLVACVLASYHIPKHPIGLAPPLGWPRQIVVALTILVITVLIVLVGIRPLAKSTTLIRQAQNALQYENYSEAHALLKQATNADPWSPLAPSMQARIYWAQFGQTPMQVSQLLQSATACLQTAIKRDPADYKLYHNLAQMQAQAGQWEEAYTSYQQTTARYPGKGRLWLEQGNIAEKCGELEAARLHLLEALAIEDLFRAQFQALYPDQPPVSRIGKAAYLDANRRLEQWRPKESPEP